MRTVDCGGSFVTLNLEKDIDNVKTFSLFHVVFSSLIDIGFLT